MSGFEGYKRPEPEAYEPATGARGEAPDFPVFEALGLNPSTATLAMITEASRRATRHRHDNVIRQWPATANAFPSQMEVNIARDWLNGMNARQFATAARNARRTWVDRFRPQFPPGSADVFGVRTATARGSHSWNPISASLATPAAAPTPATPQKKPNATPATPFTAGSGSNFSEDYIVVDSSSDDGLPATPTRQRRPRPYGPGSTRDQRRSASATAAMAAQAAAAQTTAAATMNSSSPVSATSTPRVARPSNRSGGSSMRMTAIANPITNERIIVGDWNPPNATAGPRNAVVAGFDARGRIFYRITNADRWRAVVAAPTATAVRFEHIDFRYPYAGLDAAAVRLLVDRHLRMPSGSRP
jgi:hypothetical protein